MISGVPNCICESICGAMYFPSTLTESKEIATIMKNHQKTDIYWVWIRLSDQVEEGVWKDPDNKEILTFTNWYLSEPNNRFGRQHWRFMWSN